MSDLDLLVGLSKLGRAENVCVEFTDRNDVIDVRLLLWREFIYIFDPNTQGMIVLD